MSARSVQVTVDWADPGALAAFWAEALGYLVAGHLVMTDPEGHEICRD